MGDRVIRASQLLLTSLSSRATAHSILGRTQEDQGWRQNTGRKASLRYCFMRYQLWPKFYRCLRGPEKLLSAELESQAGGVACSPRTTC
jgi:hypothetical protein